MESQESFRHANDHLATLLRAKPDLVLTDKHPGYFSTQQGEKYASDNGIPILHVQHHKAHFAAVLAENGLLESEEPILGVIFDGTGYGDDGQIWGGEFFIYQRGKMDRNGHLLYFEQIAGDKMSREPRLSAYAVLRHHPQKEELLKTKFSEREWMVYEAVPKSTVMTSSAGRLFDAVSCLLGLCDTMSYEGEAAMYLEKEASSYYKMLDSVQGYQFTIDIDGNIPVHPILDSILLDLQNHTPIGLIAFRFHLTIARMIVSYARHTGIRQIALSGGVFQNTLLVDLCHRLTDLEMTVNTHRELSPNDECISFGQIAYYSTQSS